MIPMRKLIIFLCIFLLARLPAFTQETEGGQEIVGVLIPREQEAARSRLLLSKSRENYPVTPGDVFELSYRSADREITRDVVVESDYTLNLSVFGKINSEGMTFPELKDKVEQTISDAYPNSVPFMNIKSVGLFEVLLTGEIPETQFVSAWGLSRLSEVASSRLSTYSSIRKVGMLSKDGVLSHFDLFKASRHGVVEEDPFIRPGDTVVIYSRGREVEIRGEVRRPGKYQILANEGLADAISQYASGFSAMADKSRIKVEGFAREHPRTFFVDLRSMDSIKMPDLQDGDVITISSRLQNLPVVIFEGSLISAAVESLPADLEGVTAPSETGYSRIVHTFKPGETLYDVLLVMKGSISPTADLKNAYLIRDATDERIPLNLEKLLHAYIPDLNFELEPFDRIIIPPTRYFVTVVGEVGSPGNISYVPNRRYDYYVGLAGGIPGGVRSEDVAIFDKEGKRKAVQEEIEPEDMIVVAASYVSITGAVLNPGRYQYMPGKKHTYYLDMAGGIDTERNVDNQVKITDDAGNVRNKDEILEPGDRIYAELNDFTYNFNRYFPVITTGIAFITTIITIINLLAD